MSFARYAEYAPSGAEWFDTAPVHWRILRLKRVAQLVTSKLQDGGRQIALENVESWTGRLVETESSFEGGGATFLPGDLLFGKLRPYLAKAWLAEFAGEAVGEFFVLRLGPALFGPYVRYVLLSREFIEVIDGSTFGSKMPRASWDFMGSVHLPLPPREEQEEIAQLLDGETAKLDALVAEQQRLIVLLREKRQTVIAHAVARGVHRCSRLKQSGNEWLGEIPFHWSVERVKWVARMESGHTPDKKVEAYWQDCDIPWVSLNDTGHLKDNDYIAETANNVNALGIANSSARVLPERAVVFSRDATIGRCAITTRPMAVSQHFIAWICSDQLLPEYLLLRFRSMGPELERLSLGATVRTIGMPDVKMLVTPVPPLDEQRQIVEHVRRETGRIDVLISNAERAIALLQERRAALISAAVTGQIDVRAHAPAEALAA